VEGFAFRKVRDYPVRLPDPDPLEVPRRVEPSSVLPSEIVLVIFSQNRKLILTQIAPLRTLQNPSPFVQEIRRRGGKNRVVAGSRRYTPGLDHSDRIARQKDSLSIRQTLSCSNRTLIVFPIVPPINVGARPTGNVRDLDLSSPPERMGLEVVQQGRVRRNSAASYRELRSMNRSMNRNRSRSSNVGRNGRIVDRTHVFLLCIRWV
jgi:hypothetical protein